MTENITFPFFTLMVTLITIITLKKELPIVLLSVIVRVGLLGDKYSLQELNGTQQDTKNEDLKLFRQ